MYIDGVVAIEPMVKPLRKDTLLEPTNKQDIQVLVAHAIQQAWTGAVVTFIPRCDLYLDTHRDDLIHGFVQKTSYFDICCTVSLHIIASGSYTCTDLMRELHAKCS